MCVLLFLLFTVFINNDGARDADDVIPDDRSFTVVVPSSPMSIYKLCDGLGELVDVDGSGSIMSPFAMLSQRGYWPSWGVWHDGIFHHRHFTVGLYSNTHGHPIILCLGR